MKRSLKRAGALVLGLVFLLALLPGGALAATTVASGDCGDNLTWTLDSDGVLTISGTGDMTSHPWRDLVYIERITEVVIGSGVTSIGDWAFEDCSALTTVTIPGSVTSIGYCAFAECSSLSGVIIPDGVTSIGEHARG